MSEKVADEEYYSEFFSFLNEILEDKRPYDDLFKEYTLDEVIDIFQHSISTVFLTLARMDIEMDLVVNLINTMAFIRTGDKKIDNLDIAINKYNSMSRSIIELLYEEVTTISELGLSKEQTVVFKGFVSDISEILKQREDLESEDTTSE